MGEVVAVVVREPPPGEVGEGAGENAEEEEDDEDEEEAREDLEDFLARLAALALALPLRRGVVSLRARRLAAWFSSRRTRSNSSL